MERMFYTFSKLQKEKVSLSDEEIESQLKNIGIDYVLTKQVHYIVNDVSDLNLTGEDSVTIKIKQALKEKGLCGLINI